MKFGMGSGRVGWGRAPLPGWTGLMNYLPVALQVGLNRYGGLGFRVQSGELG